MCVSTFKPLGIDVFDEVGCDVTGYKCWLGNDVSQNRDVVIHSCNNNINFMTASYLEKSGRP